MEFIHPIDGYITRNFYYLSSLYVGGQHAAIDKVPFEKGAPIRVVASGLVAGVGWDFYSGFFVAADHDNGFRSIYRHLFGQSPVAVGQTVTQGDIIGNVGSTGWSTGDHLHFDLWNVNKIRNDDAIFYKNGWYAVDPELYLGIEQEEEDMPKMRFVKGPDDKEPPWATDGVHRIGIGTDKVKQDYINLELVEPKKGVPEDKKWEPYPVQQSFINSLVDQAADIKAILDAIDNIPSDGSPECKALSAAVTRTLAKQGVQGALREGVG